MFLFPATIGGTTLLLSCLFLGLHLPSMPVLASSSPPTLLLLPTNKPVPVPASPVPDFSALTSDISLAAEGPDPVCNGDLLGFDMIRYNCFQALQKIPTTEGQRSFGDRLNGTFQTQLPRRFSGRECIYSAFFDITVLSRDHQAATIN